MMIRLLALFLVPLSGAGPRDAATIRSLVTQLSADDWVDQAKAAKELARIGKPALDHLAKITEKDAPSLRYWSEQIRSTVAKAPAPAPAAVVVSVPAADPAPSFTPDETDMGSMVFICNTGSHGDREVIVSRCTTCAKSKRFYYDHNLSPTGFRCGVCKTVYRHAQLKCDRCFLPPNDRRPIRTRR